MAEASTQAPLIVIDGYVRLSRDDNKRNYTSIENQKLIIQKYADGHNMVVRQIYEDDGYSGYSFQRPDFQRMMADINSIGVIVAKDLSRIGRHNAKVLLFLEEMEEMGKRVILIDDNYDSLYSDDEIIGIKTWDNERHVKDTSRKVRRVKRMEQENGTLVVKPPFGYTRHPLNKQIIQIDGEAASILHLEKELYLEGNGIRKTAEILNARGVPTPSMIEKERYEALGLPYRKTVAYRWSFGMVKDTLFNDYHNGVLRTHKRERGSINGKDKRVSREKQFVFPEHHPKIFDDAAMKLLCETRESRCQKSYRGQRRHVNLYSGCLYCKDCGSRLTAINRPNRPKYYICGTYNKKGTQFCACSHMVTEEILTETLLKYLKYCCESLKDRIEAFELSKWAAEARSEAEACTAAGGRQRLEQERENAKAELKLLTGQKICEIKANPSMKELITETYASLQTEKMERISAIDKILKEYAQEPDTPAMVITPGPRTAMEILEEVITGKKLNRKDIEILVDKILVDRDGSAEIYLKHGLGKQAAGGFKTEPEDLGTQMMLAAIRLLAADTTGFTSVRFLAGKLKEMGYPMHRKKFAPYIKRLLELKLVEETGNCHYPYKIAASPQRLRDVENWVHHAGADRRDAANGI